MRASGGTPSCELDTQFLLTGDVAVSSLASKIGEDGIASERDADHGGDKLYLARLAFEPRRNAAAEHSESSPLVSKRQLSEFALP